MSKVNKKILIIIIIILILSGLGFYIYYRYYAKGTIEITFQTPGVDVTFNGKDYQNISDLKLNLKSGIYNFSVSKLGYLDKNDYIEIHKLKNSKIEIKLIKSSTLNSFTNPLDISGLIGVSTNNLYLLDYTNNQINVISNSGNTEKIMDFDFLNENSSITNIQWLKNNQGIIIGLIIKYSDLNSNSNFIKLITLDDKKIFDLDSNILEITFNPENNKLAYIYQSGIDKKMICISDMSGKKWKKILDVDVSANNIIWINNSTIAYLYNSNDKIKMIEFDTDSNSMKETVINEISAKSFIYQGQISPNKKNLLIPYFDGNETNLYILNLINKNQHLLKNISPYMNLYRWKDDNTLMYVSSIPRKQNDGLANFTTNSLDINSGKATSIFTFSGYDLSSMKDFFMIGNEFYLISTDQILKINYEK